MIRVLLVEDDPMVADLDHRYVNRVEGFETVAAARNAEEALQALQDRQVDLILLDVFMAGRTGSNCWRRSAPGPWTWTSSW